MIVTVPAIKTRGARFWLERGDAIMTRINGAEAVQVRAKALWRMSAPLVPMSYDQAQPWMAALAQLSRKEARFDARPPGFELPEYAKTRFNGSTWSTGQPVLVSGSGTNISVSGLSANQSFLQRGDYLSVTTSAGPELKMVTEDVNASGTGTATVQIQPPLRGTPTAITITNPLCRFRLVDAAPYQLAPNRIARITLEAIESHG
jgi:hypothetical protein